MSGVVVGFVGNGYPCRSALLPAMGPQVCQSCGFDAVDHGDRPVEWAKVPIQKRVNGAVLSFDRNGNTPGHIVASFPSGRVTLVSRALWDASESLAMCGAADGKHKCARPRHAGKHWAYDESTGLDRYWDSTVPKTVRYRNLRGYPTLDHQYDGRDIAIMREISWRLASVRGQKVAGYETHMSGARS